MATTSYLESSLDHILNSGSLLNAFYSYFPGFYYISKYA